MSRLLFGLAALAMLASGCTTVRPGEAAADLRQSLADRTGATIVWRTDALADLQADRAVASLLADSLSADDAVQIALLNNPDLQSTYEDLGVAQAEVVQAGLLRNPVFGKSSLLDLGNGGAADLGFNVVFEFLDVFWLPLRKRVARSEYQATQFQVSEAALEYAAQTRCAFTRAQASQLRVDLQTRIVQNAEATYTAALLLREAGTIPATDFLAEQSRYEYARLDLVRAEQEAVESREALVRIMGLESGRVLIGGQIPPVPEVEPLATARTPGGPRVLDLDALEQQALEASLAVDAARHSAESVAYRLGIDQVERVLPDLELGDELTREDGPEVDLSFPLLDQGQARLAGLRSALRRARSDHRSVTVEVRSATRVLASRLAARRRVALQYQRVLVGLQQELSEQTLRQYNAGQVGVFDLLQTQEAQARAAHEYTEALAAYWDARTDLDALLAGRMPDLNAPADPTRR